VVIDKDGLILTIGYLVAKPTKSGSATIGRTLPAVGRRLRPRFRPGGGRSVAPFDCRRRSGDSAPLAESDPVLIVNYGDAATSRLPTWFAPLIHGNWEYLLDRAIFTCRRRSTGAAQR